MNKKIVISLCMGSSCFSRGNVKNLEALKEYINENNLNNQVEFKGALCEGLCKQGPNIKIDGQIYNNVDPASLVTLLNHYFKR